MTAPDGTAVIYSYDSTGKLQTIQHPNHTTQQLQYQDPNWSNGLSNRHRRQRHHLHHLANDTHE